MREGNRASRLFSTARRLSLNQSSTQNSNELKNLKIAQISAIIYIESEERCNSPTSK